MTFDAAGSLLFSPFDIRGMRMDNRIVLPAMVTRLSGEDGVVNDAIPYEFWANNNGHNYIVRR